MSRVASDILAIGRARNRSVPAVGHSSASTSASSEHANAPDKQVLIGTIDTARLLRGIMAGVEEVACEKGIDLVLYCSLCDLRANAMLLRAALRDLILGAISAGRPRRPVVIEARGECGAAVFRIHAFGRGMHIQRVELAGDTPIELRNLSRRHALSSEVARMHGGSLRLESALGVGTTATLSIPQG